MKNLKTNLPLLIGMLLVLVALAFFVVDARKQAVQDDLNTSAAGAALVASLDNEQFTDVLGNPVNLSDYLGEVLVVNSWASWSPFSQTELADLSQVASEYSGREIKILAINRAESSDMAIRYLNTINTLDNVTLVLDKSDKFYNSIGGYAMPETVFYDDKGNIVFHSHGPLKPDDIRKYLEQAIGVSNQ